MEIYLIQVARNNSVYTIRGCKSYNAARRYCDLQNDLAALRSLDEWWDVSILYLDYPSVLNELSDASEKRINELRAESIEDVIYSPSCTSSDD